jgi:hypothetical protein
MNKKKVFYMYIFAVLLTIILLCNKSNNNIITSDDDIEVSESIYESSDVTERNYDKSNLIISERNFDNDLAEILDSLGLIYGYNMDFILNIEPTRLDGIIMLIKLLGAESEVVKMDNTESIFSDVPHWGSIYINYAYINKLADCYSSSYFGANEPLSLNEYLNFILRVLGYNDINGDYIQSEAYVKGLDLGLINEDEMNEIDQDTFTWGDMIKITYNVLSMFLKDQNITLRDKLADIKKSRKEVGGKNVLISEFITDNKNDYTSAIIEANNYLVSVGGGTLIFEEGDYLVKPGEIYIPSDIKWLGEHNARIYTNESGLYNILISTKPFSNNIYIKNIIFDQMGDSALIPDAGSYNGCFLLHINNTDYVTIEDCTFYTYGVCAVLSQSNYSFQTNHITIRNNHAYFQRKTDKLYDVSVFNIDGRNVIVENNFVQSLDNYNFRNWKARTSYEVHMPNGYVANNVAIDTEVGILHTEWPMLWDTYEPDFIGHVEIRNNDIKGAIVGISIWGPTTLAGVTTRNLSITDNNIGLYLSDEYVPSQGVAIVDGGIGNGNFENVVISGNNILFTASETIDVYSDIMNLLVPGKDVGAICINTNNTIANLVISNNLVIEFPYAFINIYKRNGENESGEHRDIKVNDNIIIDSCYIHTSEMTFEGLFSIGNSTGIIIENNKVIKKQREPIYLICMTNKVSGLSFIQNDISSLKNGTVYQYTDFNIFKNQRYDIPYLSNLDSLKIYVDTDDQKNITMGSWINSRMIKVKNILNIIPGDRLFTPVNQAIIVTKIENEYLYILNDMIEWSGYKYLRKHREDKHSMQVDKNYENGDYLIK